MPSNSESNNPNSSQDDGDDPRDATEQSKLSPWETPVRETESNNNPPENTGNPSAEDGERDVDTGEDDTELPVDEDCDPSDEVTDSTSEEASKDTSKSVTVNADTPESSIAWSHRQVGESYPIDANYYCDRCNEFHAESIRELKEHVERDEEVSWSEYLEESNLHRCTGCRAALDSLTELYCSDCSHDDDDRIPCQNCGAVRVKISDPFCSSACAGERLQYGPPLDTARNPSSDWLDHPHRLPAGIPSAAPFIENHEMACRECYGYGSDNLHEFAVHVSEAHDDGWGAYIHTFALRSCRVCSDPLRSLLPLYCSDKCQHSDPDPVRSCKRDACDTAVERRQKYCSRSCYDNDQA